MSDEVIFYTFDKEDNFLGSNHAFVKKNNEILFKNIKELKEPYLRSTDEEFSRSETYPVGTEVQVTGDLPEGNIGGNVMVFKNLEILGFKKMPYEKAVEAIKTFNGKSKDYNTKIEAYQTECQELIEKLTSKYDENVKEAKELRNFRERVLPVPSIEDCF